MELKMGKEKKCKEIGKFARVFFNINTYVN